MTRIVSAGCGVLPKNNLFPPLPHKTGHSIANTAESLGRDRGAPFQIITQCQYPASKFAASKSQRQILPRLSKRVRRDRRQQTSRSNQHNCHHRTSHPRALRLTSPLIANQSAHSSRDKPSKPSIKSASRANLLVRRHARARLLRRPPQRRRHSRRNLYPPYRHNPHSNGNHTLALATNPQATARL